MDFNPHPIKTKEAPDPVGPYNQAVHAGGWLFCSGQIALDPNSGEMIGSENITLETKQVLRNLMAVIKAAGIDKNQIVKTTIYLSDLADFNEVNKVYSEFFDEGISPARACIQAAALPKGAKVEIDCIAWKGTNETQ